MKDTQIIMGMHITVEINDSQATHADLDEVFAYFTDIDMRFSTYKPESEIMQINREEILAPDYSDDMKEVFLLAEKTKGETKGYFDIKRSDGFIDPSGIVKGWAIKKAADILLKKGFKNFFVDAGGDIQSYGVNGNGKSWSLGIKDPFNPEQIVKTIYANGKGVATSGSYLRGQHIYNPHMPEEKLLEIVSLTVIGPDVLEADRFATAAFAMGKEGIVFIENLDGFEAYSIDHNGLATMTEGFESYTKTL